MTKSVALSCLFAALLLFVPAAVLPGQSPIIIEGQDAISTNFSPEPIQLYGLGGNLGLQLNQPTLLSADPYYADFVFSTEQAGEYMLWYGGSRPGAEDPFLPSYGSPFQLILNNEVLKTVYAETVAVGPFYSSPYQWVRVGSIELQAGQQVLRVSVDERRRYDSRFFLYLDRLILVPVGTEVSFLPSEGQLQEEPDSIEDLLIRLRDEPTDLNAYIQLSHLYTSVGDHINAIRYLNRAQVLNPAHPEILQLLARNRIWQGDIDGALGAYWALVSSDPQKLNSFLEAGKIAAWNGFLGASEQYYLAGLDHHPNTIQLLANLGYTYLWGAREDRARELFNRAESRASTVDEALLLAAEYRANADPSREEVFLRTMRSTFPQSHELAQQLLDAAYAQGDVAAARELHRELEQAIPDAADALARVERRYTLRDELIARYETAVLENPEDLSRRSELAQTYFWIGRRSEGIRVFRNQLALQTQQALHQSWHEDEGYLWDAIHTHIARLVFRHQLFEVSRLRPELQDTLREYRRLAEQEDADLTEVQTRATEILTRLMNEVSTAESALRLYDTTVPARMSEARLLLEEREAELTAIVESRNWSAPVSILAAELSSAEDVVGSLRTKALMTGILDREHDPRELPRRIELPAGTSEAGRRVLRRETAPLLMLNAGDPRTALAMWGTLEGLIVDEAETRPTDLLTFAELFRNSIRRAAGVDEVEGPLPNPAAFSLETAAAADTRAAELTGNISAKLQELEAHIETLQQLSTLGTELALYYLQTKTAAERTRLGRLYIDSDDISLGVQQLELVRVVDPDNLDTLYTLAQAYRRLGNWRRSQNLFAGIHAADPTFRNTVVLHNEIARSYSDQLQAETRMITEAQRIQTRSTLEYLWRVNSRYSVRAGLETTTVRAKIPASFVGPEEDSLQISVIQRLAYQEHLLHVGLPISFRGEQVLIEPTLGARFVAHNLYYSSIQGGLLADTWDAADYFGSYGFQPEPGVRVTARSNELFFASRYRFGTFSPAQDIPVETSRLGRPYFRSHYLNADLSWNLQSRTHPIWSRYSQRTGVEADTIVDGLSVEGTRYRVDQDFRYSLIRRSEPFTRLGLAAVFGFEDYEGDAGQWYYQPDAVFESGVRLDGQLYRALGVDTSWGVSGSAYAGYYEQSFSFDPDNPAIRGVARLTAELTRTNVAFQLGLSGSRVLELDESGSFPNDGGYYDFGLTLGVVARNFRLLSR
ncbi:MAG: tetratricopeptide repeat protein [Spirochaetia bacterium]